LKKSAFAMCAVLLMLSAAHVKAGVWDWIWNQLSAGPVDYGYWFCANCYIPAPGVAVDEGSISGIQAYIKANNYEIHESKNEKVHRWIPNSSITICNSNSTCLTVYYPAMSNKWLPRTGSYPLPPNVTPKVPKNPDVEVNHQGDGWVGLAPIGPAAGPSAWAITLPASASPRIVTPSVSMIFEGNTITWVGQPIDLNALNDSIGDTWDWGTDSSGLDNPVGGSDNGCRSRSDCLLLPE
jgi:hypothetical protein